MDKIQVAETILDNTKNIYLKELIAGYIQLAETGSEIDDEELIRFGNCMEYIAKTGFDVTGWGLWEIPIFYSHVFWNEETGKWFDLAVWDIGEVIPRYIKDGNEKDAASIQEAIEKYDEEP